VRIKWLRTALLDLDDLESHIAAQNPAAATDVIVKIIKAVALLKEQQALGRAGRVPGTRELVISGLPYIVPYRCRDNEVQILRVYHTSRKWPNRL